MAGVVGVDRSDAPEGLNHSLRLHHVCGRVLARGPITAAHGAGKGAISRGGRCVWLRCCCKCSRPWGSVWGQPRRGRAPREVPKPFNSSLVNKNEVSRKSCGRAQPHFGELPARLPLVNLLALPSTTGVGANCFLTTMRPAHLPGQSRAELWGTAVHAGAGP